MLLGPLQFGEFSLGMLSSPGGLLLLANITLPDDWLVAPTEAQNQNTQSESGIIHESNAGNAWIEGACNHSNRTCVMP